jgi:integrase
MQKEKSRLRRLIEESQREQRLRRDIMLTRQATGNYDIHSREDMLGALGEPVSAAAPMLTGLTAAESEQLHEDNQTKLHTEPTLANVFPAYQNWRAEGGLNGNVSDRVLSYEAGRFENYMKTAPLFNTPVSQLDDVQAVEFLHRLKVNGVAYTPRKECAKTLSQMASYLRATGKRRGPLLCQKLKVSKSDTEKKADGPQAKKFKFYHPSNEMPEIFRAADQEQFDAVAALYFGAFRMCDAKGIDWKGVEWAQFKITYWNSKGKRWDTKSPHKDLKPILQARWERQGKPESGLVFTSSRTGERWGDTYDWGLDELVHDDAGIAKQKGRKIHAFRHSGAVAAANGFWGKRWTRDDVAKLLNDSSDAVDVYFDILDETMHELASNTTSQLEEWGLTIGNVIADTPAHVTGDQPASVAPPCQG